MRPIKFRLRSQSGKIVGYEKWYEGKFRSEVGWEAFPRWLYSVDGDKWTATFILHDAKDQFTGLLDKNGKEIYEGDIVRHDVDSVDAVEFGNIGYDGSRNGLTGFGFTGHYKEEKKFLELDYYNEPDTIEVIGNIYENSELLEVKP